MTYRREQFVRTLLVLLFLPLMLPLKALWQANRKHPCERLLRHRTEPSSLPLLPLLWVATAVLLTLWELVYGR